MKKAFDANVSRARPRMRLGAFTEPPPSEPSVPVAAVEAIAEQVLQEAVPEASLAGAVKARTGKPKPTAAATLKQKLAAEPVVPDVAARAAEPAAVQVPLVELPPRAAPQAVAKSAVAQLTAPTAVAEPPAEVVEVQTAPPPTLEEEVAPPEERRERLRKRLKAVRENPRPEPLPETVAEAGVLAVERISVLQTELTKARALNLALTQDLEAARRQAERATEEARVRMDEARRLSSEMEGRGKLLGDLERELEALEAERNESLLALQEARQGLDAAEAEKDTLRETLKKKDEEVNACLAEEERLADELETAHETMASLRRSSDALKSERDTLARQVSDLTRERAELLEARKALEAVHRALSHAAAR